MSLVTATFIVSLVGSAGGNSSPGPPLAAGGALDPPLAAGGALDPPLAAGGALDPPLAAGALGLLVPHAATEAIITHASNNASHLPAFFFCIFSPPL